MKKYTIALGLCLALTGCLSSGAEKPLKEMATSLTERDATQFLMQMDIKRFSAAEVQALTQDNKPLQALDSVGKFLGLGGMDDLLGSVVDMEKQNVEYFTRGVSTGELINKCTRAQKPNCPWVPESLLKAKVKEISDSAAVAQVTTPAGMTSWLALAKLGDTWKVVGHAVLEKEATALATLNVADAVAPRNNQRQGQSSTDAPAPPPAATPTPSQPSDEPSPPPPATKL